MRGPSRGFLAVCILSLTQVAAVSPPPTAPGAPRSVGSDLLDTLDCDQNEVGGWTRPLANGREVNIVSQQFIDDEQGGRSLLVDYMTDFNPRLQSCSIRHEAWDLVNDLREEADDAGARTIRATAWNEHHFSGSIGEIDRGDDGRWTPRSDFFDFFRGKRDCTDFSAADRPPEDLLVAVDAEDVAGARALIAGGADVQGRVVANAGGELSDLEARCREVDCDAGGIEPIMCSMTPLNYAASVGDADMVDLLVRAGANVNAAPACGGSPLASAALAGHSEIFKRLLARGADTESAGPTGKTPLMIAALNANGRGVRMLLEAGADVRAKDRSGKTPLMYAVSWRYRISGEPPAASRDCHLRILRVLLSAGADPEARDRDGKSARDLAVEKHDKEALRILSEHSDR